MIPTIRSTALSVCSLGLLTVAFACSTSVEAPSTRGPDGDAGAEASLDAGQAQATPVEWKPCPLHSEGKGPEVECAKIPVPLDPANPKGKTLPFFVKRYRPTGGKSQRALWMLQGGPGASGYVFENIAEQMATRYPDVDYYIPDHRGTGQSSRLGCAPQEADDSEGGQSITEAEWGECLPALKANFGEELRFYNTSAAANDLASAIKAIKAETRPNDAGGPAPVQPHFLLGVSYGTYWAHRFVQLFPSEAAGVVFDSVFPAGGSLARQDADSDEAAHDFLDYCKTDAFCREKMGPDPWGKAQDVFVKWREGSGCRAIDIPGFPTDMLLRRVFASFLMDPSLRTYIPAVIYRMSRCEARDVTALQKLAAAVTQEAPSSEMMKQWSWGLSYNIIFSELWESPSPSVAELADIRNKAIASRDITEMMGTLYAKWPKYEPDALSRSFATADTPMLFLQGGLDPATLRRKTLAMRASFARPHQTWVDVPTATHTVFGSSSTTEGRSCGTKMFMSFIENPTTPVDTSCLSQVVPPDFHNTKTSINAALFGTNDAWE
ncbi:MAG: alpha/beta fold hydrolase [Polyangiaceae bacterium]